MQDFLSLSVKPQRFVAQTNVWVLTVSYSKHDVHQYHTVGIKQHQEKYFSCICKAFSSITGQGLQPKAMQD